MYSNDTYNILMIITTWVKPNHMPLIIYMAYVQSLHWMINLDIEIYVSRRRLFNIVVDWLVTTQAL